MIESMRNQVEFLKEHLEKEFNQTEFKMFRLFPWAIDSRTWKKVVRADLSGENLLQAIVKGEGNKARYFIKGKNIIKYINKYGPLMMGKVRKPKKLWKKQKAKKNSN